MNSFSSIPFFGSFSTVRSVLILGEKELHTNSIELASPYLEYVEIQASRTAVETMEADFINISE